MNPKSIKATAFSLALLFISGCAAEAPQAPETSETAPSVVENTPESTSAPAETSSEYKLNETWTVEGQWTLTVTDVEEMSERNEYADTEPQAVYRVTFIYENLGYTDPNGFMSGLFFVMDGSIIDSESFMGYSYPNDLVYYPEETPVGAKCKGQVCIGVDNPGAFKINVEQWDGNGERQTATFNITP